MSDGLNDAEHPDWPRDAVDAYERLRAQLDALTESAGHDSCADEMRKANARAEEAEALLKQCEKAFARACDECEKLQVENAKLQKELEQERVRLAGCGIAAGQNTAATIADRIGPDTYGWSASYEAVCAAVDREMCLRAENAKLREELAAMRKDGPHGFVRREMFRQVDEANKKLLDENAKLREEAVTLAGRVEMAADFARWMLTKRLNQGAVVMVRLLLSRHLTKDSTPHLQLVRAAMEFTKAVSAAEAGDGSNEEALAGAAHKALDAYRKAEEECSK